MNPISVLPPKSRGALGCAGQWRLGALLAKPRRLQTQLVIFALLVAIPFGAFCGYLLWRFAAQERADFDSQLQQAATTLASDIDRQLESMRTLLRTVATYRSLRERNWAAFHEQAREALEGTGHWLLVAEPSGQQTVNTSVAFGTLLPVMADTETLKRVVETRTSVVGNLFVGVISRRPIVNVALPVMDGDSIRHILLLVLTPEQHIQGILAEQGLPKGWIGGLSDANAVIVGRSNDNEKYFSTPLPAELANQRHRSGVFEARRVDGSLALRAVSRLRSADWFAAATVDRSLALAAAYKALGAMLVIGVIILIVSISGSIFLGRILTRDIVKLATAGEQLGRGSYAPQEPGIVIEINNVSTALFNAAVDLQAAQLTTARLASIATAALEALIGVDRNGTIETWNRAATMLLGYEDEDVIGQPISILVPVDQRTSQDARIAEVFQGETIRHFDSEVQHKDGRIIPVSISLAPIIDSRGRVTGLVVAAHDISERREWDRRRSLMSRELMHRVKNSLAVAQSIVRSTLRSTPDPAAFAEAFTGRLASMAAAQDIVTDGEWKGADLERLARHQLGGHLTAESPQIRFFGEPVQLPPAAAVPLGLALHELGTNAAKYGALSVPDGVVDLSWSVRVDADKTRTLHLEWRETGGPTVTMPSRQGFGGTLIERGIGDAQVERRFEPSGVICTIDLAIDTHPKPNADFKLNNDAA